MKVGDSFLYPPEYVLDVENAVVSRYPVLEYNLRYRKAEFDKAYVYVNGLPLRDVTSGDERCYEILDTEDPEVPNFLLYGESPVDPTLPAGLCSLTVRYAVNTRTPYMHWLSGTYSGSLLGMSKISGKKLPLSKDLILQFLPQAQVDYLVDRIKESSSVPPDIVNYLPTIADPLEKAVFAAAICAIYLV